MLDDLFGFLFSFGPVSTRDSSSSKSPKLNLSPEALAHAKREFAKKAERERLEAEERED